MDFKNAKDLRNYLMTDFGDEKYKKNTLLDIFRKDKNYFLKLKSSGKINNDAEEFFLKCEDKLINANSISEDIFRNFNYEFIINEYFDALNKNGKNKKISKIEEIKRKVKEKETKNNRPEDYILVRKTNTDKKQQKLTFKKKTDELKKLLMCPHDLEAISCKTIKKCNEKHYNTKIQHEIPIYKCNTCGRVYTKMPWYKGDNPVNMSGDYYWNVDNSEFYKSQWVNFSSIRKNSLRRVYVFKDKAEEQCRNEECNHNLKEIQINLMNRNKELKARKIKFCENCGMLYIPLRIYKRYHKLFICENTDEINKLNSSKSKKDTMELTLENNIDIGRENKIEIKDFVVWDRNIYRCTNKRHKLFDIEAVIEVIDDEGKTKWKDISAGYCKDCNVFFITEYMYDKLKRWGTPICKLYEKEIDDREICDRRNDNYGEMILRTESILMRYGYNVSKKNGLSKYRRRAILALLIDNEILRKNYIINFLNGRINFNGLKCNNELAVSKWEDDIDFVNEYKKGSYKKYGVRSIRR